MDGLEKQSLTTCDELYRALKLHDRENVMYRITEDDFTIKLDERFEINGYDNKDEVYLEIRMQGTPITHWHLDYSEAYAELTETLESPEAVMERAIEAEACKKKSDGCLVFGICWLVFTFVLLFILAELEKSMENINRPLACVLCLAVPVLMATAFAVGFVHPFHKKDQKENIGVCSFKMYPVTVTTRYLKDKDVLRLLAPLFIWMVLFFVLFAAMCITDISILVLPLFFEFLCIIPVAIRLFKNAKKLHQASFVKLDVVLTAKAGILYKDNIKLDAAYSMRDREIYLENTHDAGKYNRRLTTFWGTISEEDVDGFLAFCQENKIELEVFNE